MKKKFKVSLITLFAAVLSAVLIAVCLFTSRTAAVYAADRYVTVDGNNVFYTAIRGAEVVAEPITEKGEDDKDVERYYTTFKIGKDEKGESETVAYRKSLAYEWMTGNFDDNGIPTGEPNVNHFNMTIGFPSLGFNKFIIKFQSQQYLNNKDNISENYLVFAKQDGDKIGVAAVQSLEDEITSYPVSFDFVKNGKIKIAFSKFEQGKVSIEITAAGAIGSGLNFENVYFPYASYVSSGDNAVTPLTFSAELEDEQDTADMRLFELNGQSFEMYAHDSDGIYNDVKDTAPPVLCFTKTPSYVEFGKTLNFSYQVLDVLASSPRVTPCFYVLTGKQYAANDFNYSQIEYEESSSKDETDKEEYEYPFTKVNTGSDIRVIRDDKTFVPAKYLEDSNVYGLVKVYFEISDISTTNSAQKDNVFLEWYANEDALVDIYGAEYKNDSSKHEYFLKIIDGKSGATYAQDDTSLESYKQTIKKLEEDYQLKIKEAIENLEDKKLYAGGDNKFYLPALDELISGDEYCNLQDYKYSIYYRAKSTGSNTSLDYNKLAISLSEADVTYRFTIFVTDAFGNPMRYPTGLDENGETIWEEIKAEDVWKDDYADLLPFFEFDVSYKAATAENPDSLSVAYVGTAYSGVSFDIKGVTDTYTAKYNLYIFDRNAMYGETGLNLTYSQFEENFEKLFNNEYKEGVNTRKYFTTVKPSSELKDTDEHYDLFKKIGWNATNVSFTPQTAEDFYIVRLTLTDNRSQQSTTHFATVAASIQANSLKGESEWVQNNVAAIVLLCVAGVLFIAFIVLLVVKPKDKGDIDEIYENDKKSGKKKSK